MPRPAANAVRIIGGACRGRIVRFPVAAQLRPTPDRVRETLFNWLGQDLSGLATLAVAVDREARLVSALRDNAARLGLQGLESHRGDARRLLDGESRAFDVVFLDPPFADDPWSWLLPACAARLAYGGAIYAEAGRPVVAPPGLTVVRSARAGQVYYHLLRA